MQTSSIAVLVLRFRVLVVRRRSNTHECQCAFFLGGSPTTNLAIGPVLDDGVALAEGFEVAEKAVGGAGVDADGRRVLGGDV